MVFEEYEVKKFDKRINVKYERNAEDDLNPWEITNFVSRVTSYLYKLELLQTIAMALEKGVDANQIFILDREYKLNGKYEYFSELNLLSYDVNRLYSIGKPISMTPNREIYELRLLFEYLYKTNQILYKHGKKRINAGNRVEAYACLLKDGVLETVKYIDSESRGKLHTEESKVALKALEKEKSTIEKKNAEYAKDQESFEKLSKVLNGELEIEDEKVSEQYMKLASKYYNSFFEYFTKLQRPVVGIFWPDRQVIQVLCADHFDDAISYNTHIDLKSITHNSPIMSEIAGGCSIAAMYKDEKRKQEIHELEKRKLELEIENLQKDSFLKDQEARKNELDIVNKELQTRQMIWSMAQTQESSISKLEDSYTTYKIKQSYDKIKRGYAAVLQDNGFDVTGLQVIDIKA